MNIQHSNRPRIIAPFTALWSWLMTKPGQPTRSSQIHANAATSLSSPCSNTQHTQKPGAAAYAGRCIGQPLRVLRVMDTDLAPAQIGRLRISGRMADVCAELDRLATHEAQFH